MRDEIIRMAREAGYGDAMAELHAPALERFYNLAVQHERDKFCSDLRRLHDSYSLRSDPTSFRARGEKQ